MPSGTNAVLNARTLATAHGRLAQLLRPGMAVLDVGCGTGAITRGIAEAVAPSGTVVGIDSNAGLIEEARRLHEDVPGLTFARGDAYNLPFRESFDIATAARVLQWLAEPRRALDSLIAAVRPGGQIVVLDYNHEKIAWEPEPPASMRTFYQAFLDWRASAGMDNAIADHLADLFRESGLHAVAETPQHEVTRRGDPDFETRIAIWAQVAETRGMQMVADGFITEKQRRITVEEYRAWIASEAQSQTLYLVAVEGRRADAP